MAAIIVPAAAAVAARHKQAAGLADAMELLDGAERCFADGRHRAGAESVWNAMLVAVAKAAMPLGLPCRNRGDAFAVAARRDDLAGGNGRYHLYVSLADHFRECSEPGYVANSEYDWQPDDYLFYCGILRRFIADMAGETA